LDDWWDATEFGGSVHAWRGLLTRLPLASNSEFFQAQNGPVSRYRLALRQPGGKIQRTIAGRKSADRREICTTARSVRIISWDAIITVATAADHQR